ncbi:MAG: aspartate/glutamate racemase family protein [Synergistaceae bacterium]|jgi:allantoin racemase|nr:aspartate/glutamate racemase family protein [Synergistaceae bacterium]
MRVVIINPNTDQVFTERIGRGAAAVAAAGTEIECFSAPGAPPFIENYKDEALCAPGMIALGEEWAERADAFVIACTCDPNLNLLRELTDKPVLGAGECSMLLALTLGHRFSILQVTAHSVPMKRDLVRKYGLEPRLASVVAIDENGNEEMEEKLYRAGTMAVERDGAEVLALGCAGLGGLDSRLSARLGVPVVDGVTASVKMAEALVSAGYKTGKKGGYAAREG